jgi:rfaE bifunctional protein kinase chain/domain
MYGLTTARIDEILRRATSLRVLVVGDLMLDVYLNGSVTRISPEAPVPVVLVQSESAALGGAANVAANVAALGAACDVVGAIGRDRAGDELGEALAALGGTSVRGLLVECPDRPTTTKTRVMARNQQVVRYDREVADDLPDDAIARVVDLLQGAIDGADAVVLEDYNKGVLAPRVISAALAAAERRGVPSVVDPKFRHFFVYRGATVFKPNVLELGAALGGGVHAHDDAWMEQARERMACEHLLVTQGEDGMSLQSRGRPTFRIPTVARDVFDVSGAGDTVTACVAVSLAAGATMEEAAVLANLAAGVEVGKHGVATVSPAELRAALENAGPHTPLP